MLWLALVGIGSGMFNSPNTAAMMGTVPTERRGIAAGRADDAAEHRRRDLDRLRAGDRHRRGAETGPLQDLLRPRLGPASAQLDPFIHNMHTALWVLAATSVVGAGVSLLRAARRSGPRREAPPRRARSRRRSARRSRRRHERSPSASLRIGDVAKLAGTTPRTIRYYEEIGLLPAASAREPGAHRTYAEEDVERLTDLLRLKDLLGSRSRS